MDLTVQQSVVANLSHRPRTVHSGPFVIGWDPDADSRFINYATPHPGAAIGPADVAALVAEFRAIGRIPRLEYVTSAAPDLEKLLLDAGFAVEVRHEYLVCTTGTFADQAAPAGFELTEPATDDERAAMVAAQNEAFGGLFETGPADIERTRRNQTNGAVAILARADDGEPAGGGGSSPPQVGLSEIGGIATRPQYRRRGLAGAVTAAITRRILARGDTAWLEAGSDDSWRVYERVGFVPTGQRLYIALD